MSDRQNDFLLESRAIPKEWFEEGVMTFGVPTELRDLIAQIHLLWGSTEVRLHNYTSVILERGTKGAPRITKLERKWAVRKIISAAKEYHGWSTVQVWETFRPRLRMATALRNDLAHGHVIGVLKNSYLIVAINRINERGVSNPSGWPMDHLETARTILALLDKFLADFAHVFGEQGYRVDITDIGFERPRVERGGEQWK